MNIIRFENSILDDFFIDTNLIRGAYMTGGKTPSIVIIWEHGKHDVFYDEYCKALIDYEEILYYCGAMNDREMEERRKRCLEKVKNEQTEH